jgi:hypothetical protein
MIAQGNFVKLRFVHCRTMEELDVGIFLVCIEKRYTRTAFSMLAVVCTGMSIFVQTHSDQ